MPAIRRPPAYLRGKCVLFLARLRSQPSSFFERRDGSSPFLVGESRHNQRNQPPAPLLAPAARAANAGSAAARESDRLDGLLSCGSTRSPSTASTSAGSCRRAARPSARLGLEKRDVRTKSHRRSETHGLPA